MEHTIEKEQEREAWDLIEHPPINLSQDVRWILSG